MLTSSFSFFFTSKQVNVLLYTCTVFYIYKNQTHTHRKTWSCSAKSPLSEIKWILCTSPVLALSRHWSTGQIIGHESPPPHLQRSLKSCHTHLRAHRHSQVVHGLTHTYHSETPTLGLTICWQTSRQSTDCTLIPLHGNNNRCVCNDQA